MPQVPFQDGAAAKARRVTAGIPVLGSRSSRSPGSTRGRASCTSCSAGSCRTELAIRRGRRSTRPAAARCSSSQRAATRTATSTSSSVAAERLADELDTPRTARSARRRARRAPDRTISRPSTARRGVAPRRSRSLPGARSRSRCSPTSSPTSSRSPDGDYSDGFVAISRPEPRRRLKLPRNLSGGRGLQPYSRADAPYFRSPGFYVRVGGLAIVVAAGCSLLALRAWSIQVLHGKQYAGGAHTGVPDRPPARPTRRDRRRQGPSARRHHRPRRDLRRRRFPRLAGTRTASGARAPAGLQEIRRLATVHRHGAGGVLVARIRADVLHAPFAPGRRHRASDRSADELPAGAARRVPGLQGRGECQRGATRRARSAASSSACSARSASGSSSPTPTRARRRARSSGQSGVEAAYDSLLNAGFVQAKIPVNSLGQIAGAAPRAAAEAAADAAALDRHAPPDARPERAAQRDGAGAPQRQLADRELRSRDRPVDGRDQGDRELSRRSTRSSPRVTRTTSRSSTTSTTDDPDLEPRDRRRVSHGLDLQADHRRGGAQRRDHHAVHATFHAPARSRSEITPSTTSSAAPYEDDESA